MSETQVRSRRFSRVEYEQLVERGVFKPDERPELIGGLLVVREPPRATHAFGAELATAALQKAFGGGYRVRAQLPVALDDESEPEPDVSVVRGSLAQADRTLPSRPELIVEVAESSLTFDRRAGGRHSGPYGWRYASARTLTGVDVVFPLSAPLARIAITDLLP